MELNAFLYRMERNLARLYELRHTSCLQPLGYQAWLSPQALNLSDAAGRRVGPEKVKVEVPAPLLP